MITRLSRNVSSFFIRQGTISEEDRDVYEYSFEVLFATALGFITVIIIALISRTVLYTLLFLLGFIPLRMVAGGFHAKNHFKCFIALMIVYTTFLVLLFILPASYISVIIFLCAIASLLLVFLLAPSEDKNKPISSKNSFEQLKKNSRILIIIYVVAITLFVIFLPDVRIAFSISIGVACVGVSLFINYLNMKCMGDKRGEQKGGKAL